MRRFYKKRYNRRKRFGRRRFHKRKPATKQTLGIGRGLLGDKPMDLVIHKGLGFPGRMRTKLRYSESISMTSTTGAISYYAFSANGLYDPNITGTGHQPMYFDQYMAVYDHFKVLGSKIQVRPLETGTSLINPTWCSVVVNDDYTLSSSTQFGIYMEQGLLDQYRIIGGAYVQGHKPMGAKFSTKKWYKDKYTSAQLSGDVGANPAETVGFIVVQQPMDGVSTVTIQYEVVIDYICEFYELRDMAQS